MPQMAPLGSQRVSTIGAQIHKKRLLNVALNVGAEITQKSVVLGWPDTSKIRLPPGREPHSHFCRLSTQIVEKGIQSDPNWSPNPSELASEEVSKNPSKNGRILGENLSKLGSQIGAIFPSFFDWAAFWSVPALGLSPSNPKKSLLASELSQHSPKMTLLDTPKL